jgi:hypothetical protein
MALDFPIAPSSGDLYRTWKFDGSRWRKRPLNALNLQQFGVVGDGAANDTAAVTAAFAYAASEKIPLWVTGGGIYAVDSVPLLSNLRVLGDGNTTFRLKANASGSMFVWPTGATTSRVTFSRLLLDGNFANQAGAPHNLIHSIFVGADSTSIVADSVFDDLYFSNVDGMAIGTLNGAAPTTFNDCVFRDLRVFHHTQTAFVAILNRCTVGNFYSDNASNTSVPFSGQGNAYGLAVKASRSVIRGIRVALSVTAQTLAGGGTAGISLVSPSSSDGYNTLTECDVDCGGCTSNFGYSIDTGKGNKVSKCTAHNGNFNCDFGFFTQTDLQVSDIYSENSQGANVGIIWRDCTHCSLSGYKFKGTTNAEEAMFFQGTISGISINNYFIDTAFSAFQIPLGSAVKFTNGTIKNCVNAFDGAVSTAADWVIDGVDFDGGSAPSPIPWDIDGVTRITIANFAARNMSSKAPLTKNCVDLSLSNIQGVDFTKLTLGAGSIRGLRVKFDGGRICTSYNVPTDGGSVGTKNLGVTLPKGAIVTRVFTSPSVTFASSSNTAKIALGVTGTPAAFLAATVITAGPITSPDLIINGIVPGDFFYNGTEQQITLTVSVQALTAGMMQINIDYIMNAF